MAFYTFIMEYAGGTYISPVKAQSAKAACVKWARSLDVSQVQGLGLKGKESLIEQVRDEFPVALAGLSNAWCTGALLRGEFALINLVQTEPERKRQEESWMVAHRHHNAMQPTAKGVAFLREARRSRQLCVAADGGR